MSLVDREADRQETQDINENTIVKKSKM